MASIPLPGKLYALSLTYTVFGKQKSILEAVTKQWPVKLHELAFIGQKVSECYHMTVGILNCSVHACWSCLWATTVAKSVNKSAIKEE